MNCFYLRINLVLKIFKFAVQWFNSLLKLKNQINWKIAYITWLMLLFYLWLLLNSRSLRYQILLRWANFMSIFISIINLLHIWGLSVSNSEWFILWMILYSLLKFLFLFRLLDLLLWWEHISALDMGVLEARI